MQFQKLEKDQTQPGDVLLCFSSEMAGEEEFLYGYSHAAICTVKSGVVESSNSGVSKTDISSLLEEYGHIAVLRNSELWSTYRSTKLDEYAINQLGKKFNKVGMYKVPLRKEKQQGELKGKIEGYFNGTFVPPSHERNTYFCSELITSAFIHVGIIDKSASIILNPSIFSPEDIGYDKAFGFFSGYILPYEDYVIPESDIFRTSV